jgi:hypothetical protein
MFHEVHFLSKKQGRIIERAYMAPVRGGGRWSSLADRSLIEKPFLLRHHRVREGQRSGRNSRVWGGSKLICTTSKS